MAVKLLIAEDESMSRNGMERYIRLHTDRFEKIYLASDGQEAIDILFRHKPQMMILDIQMPVKTGIEVMREAAAAGIMPLTIVLSGYEEFAYAQQAIKYGVKDYMLKPCRSSEMLNHLLKYADQLDPQNGKSDEEEQNEHHIVALAKRYIDEHYSEDIALADVAEQAGISSGYLSTLFKQHTETGFVGYLNEVRIEHACAYFQQHYFKTYEIAYKVGFHDEKYFSKMFKKIKGVSPSEYKKSL